MLLALLLAAAAPDCARATTQADMNRCADGRAIRADAALNAAWARRYPALGPARPAFLTAQRQWLRFRDAECAAEGAIYDGGSLRPMVVAGCRAELTEERTRRLDTLTKNR